MITAFLLLPVIAILFWLYSRFLPQRGKLILFDYGLFVLVILLASTLVYLVEQVEWVDAGPIWPQVLAAVGAYVVVLGGLAAGLGWRRYRD
jgi:hypothetical protein